MKLKRILCAILSVCLMTMPFAYFSSIGAVAAEDANSLQQQLLELDEENKKNQEILDKANSEIKDKEEYSKALTSKIKNLNEKITLTSQSIEKLDEEIADKQSEIDKDNTAIDEQLDALCARLRTIYMAGTASDLEVILGAKDFSDFIDKMTLLNTLTNYDRNIINDINSKLDKVEEEKSDLDTQKEELEEQKASLEKDKNDLNDTIKKNEKLLKDLYKTKKKAEDDINSSADKEDALQAKITAYYARQAQRAGSDDGAKVSKTGFVWPTPGFYTLSSLWNEDRTTYNHGAIDIAGGGIMGARVVSAYGGTVIDVYTSCPHNWGKSSSCGCNGGYGNYAVVDHGNGKVTVYGHLTAAVVKTGDTVKRGQTLGYVGSTGNSSGAHLHFECRYNGVKYNPMIEYE